MLAVLLIFEACHTYSNHLSLCILVRMHDTDGVTEGLVKSLIDS